MPASDCQLAIIPYVREDWVRERNPVFSIPTIVHNNDNKLSFLSHSQKWQQTARLRERYADLVECFRLERVVRTVHSVDVITVVYDVFLQLHIKLGAAVSFLIHQILELFGVSTKHF